MDYHLELFNEHGSNIGDAVADNAEQAIELGVWYRTNSNNVCFVNIVKTGRDW